MQFVGLIYRIFVKAQQHGEYLGNIYGEYLCGLKIIYGLVWVFLLVG